MEKEYKEKFVDELEEQVWRKKAMVVFDRTKIPEIEKLIEGKQQEIIALEGIIKTQDDANTKESRIAKKKSNLELKDMHKFVSDCQQTITAIQESLEKEEARISNLVERITFIKSFDAETYAK
jgi:hypothetical protein